MVDFFLYLHMGYKRKKFVEKGFDMVEYQRYFHQHQASYIRIKLVCLLSYFEGKEFLQISEVHKVHIQSVRSYVNTYILGGFSLLCEATKRVQPCFLNTVDAQSFKEILLSKRPFEVGFEGNIWTGAIMCAYLSKTYNVVYKSGIYDLLERLGLSHQKAHSDYGNAVPSQQIAFIDDLKTTLLATTPTSTVLMFDEFSVCEKPTSYYGWAEKNTRPSFITNEKKEKEPTDF